MEHDLIFFLGTCFFFLATKWRKLWLYSMVYWMHRHFDPWHLRVFFNVADLECELMISLAGPTRRE